MGVPRPASSLTRTGRGSALLSCGDVEANPGPGSDLPLNPGANAQEHGPPIFDVEMVAVSQIQEQPVEHPSAAFSQHMILDTLAADVPAALEFLVNCTAAQLRSVGVEPDLPALRETAKTALAGGLPPLPAILGILPALPNLQPDPVVPRPQPWLCPFSCGGGPWK